MLRNEEALLAIEAVPARRFAIPIVGSRTWITRLWVVALALIAVLAVAPAAFATTVVTNVGGDDLRLSGSDGDDHVTATVVPNPFFNPDDENSDRRAVKVEDPAGAVAGAGPFCRQGPDANTAFCQASQTASFLLNAGNDTLRFTYSSASSGEVDCMEIVELAGGAGNDKILGGQCTESLTGGAGDDLLDGGAGVCCDFLDGDGGARGESTPTPGRDRVYGGPGPDFLQDSEGPSPAADTLSGGSCPAGTDGFCPSPAPAEAPGDADTILFSFTAGVTLNLGFQGTPGPGDPSQGEPGEGNTVVGVENAVTGSGADTVTGNAAVNEISTGDGDDSVDVSGDGANADSVGLRRGNR